VGVAQVRIYGSGGGLRCAKRRHGVRGVCCVAVVVVGCAVFFWWLLRVVVVVVLF